MFTHNLLGGKVTFHEALAHDCLLGGYVKGHHHTARAAATPQRTHPLPPPRLLHDNHSDGPVEEILVLQKVESTNKQNKLNLPHIKTHNDLHTSAYTYR